MGKKGFTLLEILVVLVILGLLAAILLPALGRPRQSIHPPACISYLKQLGLVLSLYANENGDRFPPIDDTENNFMFDATLLYPEYLNDPSTAHCPQHQDYDWNKNFRLHSDHPIDGTPAGEWHPDCVTDNSYIYLGWLVTSDEEAEALFEVYDNLEPEDHDRDIVVPEGEGNAGSDKLHRLSAGADKFLITNADEIDDIQVGARMVPLIWDRPYTDPSRFSHSYGNDGPGGNVLYLDGHGEYVLLGEKFPMTETMARLLEECPRAPIPHCGG